MKMRRHRRARAEAAIQGRRTQMFLNRLYCRLEDRINEQMTRAMVRAFSLLGDELPAICEGIRAKCREIFDQVPGCVEQSEVHP